MPFCSGPHALRRPVAIAGAVVKGGAAVLIASRLIFRDQEDLGIGDSGNVKLIVAAIALAALAAGLAGAGRSSAEEESIEEKPAAGELGVIPEPVVSSGPP